MFVPSSSLLKHLTLFHPSYCIKLSACSSLHYAPRFTYTHLKIHRFMCQYNSSICYDSNFFLSKRYITSNSEQQKIPEEQPKQLSLTQRFKEAYKVYGKVIIVVHGITSAAWLGAFYLTALSGINVADLFAALSAPPWIIDPLRGGGGIWATVLVMYKLAAPLRYAFTLGATKLAVQALRIRGYAPPIAEQDRLRNLARQGATVSRQNLKQRISISKQKLKRSLRKKNI